MIPLSGKTFPSTVEELTEAISTALRDALKLNTHPAVTIDGKVLSDIKSIHINLDGAVFNSDKPPPKPIGIGDRHPGPKVETLKLTARPLQYGQAKVNLTLDAQDLAFDFDRDRSGNPLLVLTQARCGNIDVRISKRDIEHLVSEAATLAARQQGITIQHLQLDLKSAGPGSIAADVRVKAKKLMMTGVIRLAGQVTIDDQLNARISHLECTGEGIVGSGAAAVLQKKIGPHNGASFSLLAFNLGDMSLRDVQIHLSDDLRVTAELGS